MSHITALGRWARKTVPESQLGERAFKLKLILWKYFFQSYEAHLTVCF